MDSDALFRARHSLAHLLAKALLERDPEAGLTIGPVIERGFYYDVAFSDGKAPKPEDFPAIVDRMRELAKQDLKFTEREASADEARAALAGNSFKLELVDEIAGRGEKITFYDTLAADGSVVFSDLCSGPHVLNTSEIDPDGFTIDRVAGAYWRGDEKKPMLTRVYGLAFSSKAELEAYIAQQTEAAKRDHKVLGPALGIYTISPLVGAGLPLLKPKGAFIKNALESYLWEIHEPRGYSRVWTPHITKEALYEKSGHIEKFGENLFRVQGRDEQFFLKPMNCPHHMQIYADNQFSYRDMPVRYFESTTVYRDEKSGQLGGLTRVRAITQDDGHLFCRPAQLEEEARAIVSAIKEFYSTMGMMDGYRVQLSLRGSDRSQYLGGDEAWASAERALKAVCESENLPYTEVLGEAAFYGPKLDFMFKDVIGREWQLSTIQCDFNMPERFDLSYINEKSEKERPVVIHRAIAGSLERFMGVMIEHFAGAFPLWLSPVQIAIVPVKDAHIEAAKKLAAEMRAAGLRPEVDEGGDSFGKKIRNAKTAKTPYIVVLGDKEAAGEITLEARGDKKFGPLSFFDAIAKLVDESRHRLLAPEN